MPSGLPRKRGPLRAGRHVHVTRNEERLRWNDARCWERWVPPDWLPLVASPMHSLKAGDRADGKEARDKAEDRSISKRSETLK